MKKENLYGVIWDLDGVLAATQDTHSASQACVLEQQNIKIDPKEISQKYAGIPAKIMFQMVAPHCNADLLTQESWMLTYAAVERQGVKIPRSIYPLLQKLKQQGHVCAIASSSPVTWIELVLQKARPWEVMAHPQTLAELFGKNYVSGEQCARPKPAPDVFLAAQEMLKKQTSVSHWVGVGDGVADIKGLLAANIPAVYLSTDTQFDGKSGVTRFATSMEVACYLQKQLSL